MIEFEEFRDERPESREAEAGQRPSPLPLYDPLMEPWDGVPSQAAFLAAETGEDPLSLWEWGSAWELEQAQAAAAWQPVPVGAPRQERGEGAWRPMGYERPQQEAEGLGELRRRLREETITIPRPQRRWAVTIREVVETLLLALLIFLAVRTSFQNFRVEGLSMMPSLQDGEYLIVNKLSYAQMDLSIFNWLPFFDAGDNPQHHLWEAPARGDVIVFRSPTNVERDFIKRIIGVPGDTIEIVPEQNQVLVNGQAVEEPYIQGATTCSKGCGPWAVPPANSEASITTCGSEACYFVMGDNRENSSDSRQGWLVPEENIIGKTLITYWHKGGPDLKLAPNHSVSPANAAPAEQ